METDLEMLEALEADSKWVTDHYDDLKKYENKVIAIKNRKVIGVSDRLDKLLKELEDKKENTAFLLIEAIPPKDASFIL